MYIFGKFYEFLNPHDLTFLDFSYKMFIVYLNSEMVTIVTFFRPSFDQNFKDKYLVVQKLQLILSQARTQPPNFFTPIMVLKKYHKW